MTKLCEIRNCTRPHNCYSTHLGPKIGVCKTHYSQIRRAGILSVYVQPHTFKPKDITECQVINCHAKPHKGHVEKDGRKLWVCTMHHQRFRLHGTFDAAESKARASS